jgi:release factor glutamine methyltransferase
VAAPAAIRFGPIDVAFDDGVLRPRPWTLAQSQWAAELSVGAPILELGCGAGHIGLAAAALAGAPVVQVDREPAACRWAARNASANGLGHRAEQRCGRVEDVVGVDERFTVVVADPPYVPTEEVALYPEDPRGAIDGGHDGLDAVRSFLTAVAGHVDPAGSVILQLRGLGQVAELERWLAHPSSPALAVAEARSYGDLRALVRLGVTAGAA